MDASPINKRHCFENRSYGKPAASSDLPVDLDGSDTDSSGDESNPEYCAERFRELLIELKRANKLSAKDCCVLSWLAENGGMTKPPKMAHSLHLPHCRVGSSQTGLIVLQV